jgi:hypothetical protein
MQQPLRAVRHADTLVEMATAERSPPSTTWSAGSRLLSLAPSLARRSSAARCAFSICARSSSSDFACAKRCEKPLHVRALVPDLRLQALDRCPGAGQIFLGGGEPCLTTRRTLDLDLPFQFAQANAQRPRLRIEVHEMRGVSPLQLAYLLAHLRRALFHACQRRIILRCHRPRATALAQGAQSGLGDRGALGCRIQCGAQPFQMSDGIVLLALAGNDAARVAKTLPDARVARLLPGQAGRLPRRPAPVPRPRPLHATPASDHDTRRPARSVPRRAESALHRLPAARRQPCRSPAPRGSSPSAARRGYRRSSTRDRPRQATRPPSPAADGWSAPRPRSALRPWHAAQTAGRPRRSLPASTDAARGFRE